MPKSRLSAALSLLLVFVSGGLVGVLAHRAYVTSAGPAASPNLPKQRRDPADYRKHFNAIMQDRLKLNADQLVKLNQIMDGVDARFREINERRATENQAIQKSMVEQINGILTPDQQKLYADFREERERERQKFRDHRPGGPPPPGPPPGR